MRFIGAKYAKNALEAGAPSQTPLGEFTALPETFYLDLRDLLLRERQGRGGGERRGRERKGREEKKWRKRGKGREGKGSYRYFFFPTSSPARTAKYSHAKLQ